MGYRAVDCMGFAGGFTLGMVQAGYELVGKRELPGGFGVANCEGNRHLLGDGWRTEVAKGENWSVVDADVVFGNPPCSGFSVMTAQASRGINANINSCMWHFSNYVARVKPVISIMESVRQAHVMGHELMLNLRRNVELQTGLKYNIHHVYQNALDLGGAAKRPRYFFVLSQIPFGVEWPTVIPPTMKDIIGDLDGLKETWEPQPYRRPATWWSAPARSEAGVVDGHIGLRNSAIQRTIELIHQSDVGWPERWYLALVLKRYYEQHGQLPPAWLPYQDKILRKEFRLGFTTMARWPADEPARVITGAALGAVLHPWEHRPITHRETARIMGFPDDWTIQSIGLPSNKLSATWGKGITVHCGRWIGGWAMKSLDGEPGEITGEEVGEREFFITLPKKSPNGTIQSSGKRPSLPRLHERIEV